MWGTSTLRTLANEDLGTVAEYDPLTSFVPRGQRKRLNSDMCTLIDRSTLLVEPYNSLSRASSTSGAVPSAASHDSFSRVLSLHCV